MTNPVRRVASRQIHEGNLVKLRLDSVVLPRGTEATFEYVEIKNGSSTLALEDNGDVWLVREWKYAVDRPSLEVVSGGIEPGEAPLAAAQRELREEAGLIAEKWTPMSFVDPFTTMLRCPNHLFLAQGLTPVARDPEEAEVMEIIRMPLSEAVQLVMEGGITHGSSCVAILKAAELLRSFRSL
jgi:ADP-ribose pyrophosphatase